MKARRLQVITLALSLWATAAWGDGGELLLHQDAGPFSVSLYAAPVPLTTGVADLSVIVQQRDSGEILLDPVIDITVAEQTVPLTRANSTNRLMQSGEVHLARPGRYRLDVHVRRGNDVALVSTDCLVAASTTRAGIVWFYVLLPLTVILIFLSHQFLKRKPTRPGDATT